MIVHPALPPTFDTRDALEAHHLTALNALLVAQRANAFYRPLIDAAGLQDGTASLDHFRDVMPLTTKPQIVDDQQRHPPFGRNLSEPVEHYSRLHQTSGTSGAPLRWLDTPTSWAWMVGNWMQVFVEAGVTPRDRVGFAFSFGPFLGFWTAFEAATAIGALSLPAGGMSSAARLRMLLDNEATVLCCTPTYALRLGEVAAAEGIDLKASKVHRIIVAGEPGGSVPATRNAIEAAWPGARVFDHHGMTEVGPVSYEHPTQPGMLHIIEAAYIAEIIDPTTTQPATLGETGELVLTTLGRTGSPLIRYRTGDLVKQADATTQNNLGRVDIALVGGVLARVDDMVLVRGVNVYPSAIDDLIRSLADVAEYQVVVDEQAAMTELRIRVEPTADAAASTLAGRVANVLRDAMQLRVTVELVPPGELPRFEMKAQRWIRNTR